MVLVLLPVHPLHEVAERGCLSAVVCLLVAGRSQVPSHVGFGSSCHVLSPPGKHSLLVRVQLTNLKVVPGLAALRITQSPALKPLADDFLTNLDVYVVSHSLSP